MFVRFNFSTYNLAVQGKELLEKFVQAVLSAPESLRLTGTRDPAEFWQRHVLDALKLVELFPPSDHNRPCKVLDVGSGNGVPGIPAAIAVPAWDVDLLESNKKKIGFLDMFCKFNGLKNVHTIVGRAEVAAHGKMREAYDIVYARALGKLPIAIELASPFVRMGGVLVVPHGTSWHSELERSKKAIKELGMSFKDKKSYSLGEGPTFTALLFEKTHSSPEKYPRATGIPAKRPL
jgi:16S rRNA (guanine527-N7)-methyltransferase